MTGTHLLMNNVICTQLFRTHLPISDAIPSVVHVNATRCILFRTLLVTILDKGISRHITPSISCSNINCIYIYIYINCINIYIYIRYTTHLSQYIVILKVPGHNIHDIPRVYFDIKIVQSYVL